MEFVNESFKIIQYTDMHLAALDGTQPDTATLELVKSFAKKHKPDLLVFTGDIVRDPQNGMVMSAFVDFMDDFVRFPWAYCFGNHDADGRTKFTTLIKELCRAKRCVYSRSEGDTRGDGLYMLPLYGKNNNLLWTLYFLDSNETQRNNKNEEEFPPVSYSQITRFRSIAKRYDAPSLVFFHTPLIEHYDMLHKHPDRPNNKHEFPPPYNTGFYTALCEHGKVRGAYVGHDHKVSLTGTLHGDIHLGFGKCTGARVSDNPGARVFELKTDGTCETYII